MHVPRHPPRPGTANAWEMIGEAGTGAAASFIPIVGSVVAAGLDYVIATKMTDRVGKMLSIYFQNGCKWRGNQHDTYNDAKNLTGSLNDIRREMPDVVRLCSGILAQRSK